MKFDVRYANHPDDSKRYDTAELREKYLIEKLFAEDDILLTYSHQDRIIAGGAMPVKKSLSLGTFKELATNFFLERREMGVINIGGAGTITLDGKVYNIGFKEGIYIGMGTKEVTFASDDASKPAKFYINSCPAHKTYPTVKITKPVEGVPAPEGTAYCIQRHLGTEAGMNKRTINQFIIGGVCQSCQLSMGMTELAVGSSWNTLPSCGVRHDKVVLFCDKIVGYDRTVDRIVLRVLVVNLNGLARLVHKLGEPVGKPLRGRVERIVPHELDYADGIVVLRRAAGHEAERRYARAEHRHRYGEVDNALFHS